MPPGISQKAPRMELVDALRGFAVMSILLLHSLEHFIFPVYPAITDQPAWLNILDQGIFTITFSFFAGKAYAIFALLFGLTFYIQYTNQQHKGKDFGYRFLWRLILLAGFATINAAFFPAGDVLLLFSIAGIFLFFIRKWSDKAILITAIILLLQPMEWLHYLTSLLNPTYTLPDLHIDSLYKTIATYTKEGNFWLSIKENVTLGQKASLLWAIGAGRFLQTIGLFMLGILIGRKQLFCPTEKNIRFWIKALIIAAIAYAPLYQLTILLTAPDNTPLIQKSIGVVLDMWQKFAFTTVLVASFVWLYQKEAFRKLTSNLRFYGKMSLTNYISQSIAGAIIYFPIGFSLAPYCGYTLSFIIGFLLFFLQVRFCKWWLKSHKQGPLESLWHKLTWLKQK